MPDKMTIIIAAAATAVLFLISRPKVATIVITGPKLELPKDSKNPIVLRD